MPLLSHRKPLNTPIHTHTYQEESPHSGLLGVIGARDAAPPEGRGPVIVLYGGGLVSQWMQRTWCLEWGVWYRSVDYSRGQTTLFRSGGVRRSIDSTRPMRPLAAPIHAASTPTNPPVLCGLPIRPLWPPISRSQPSDPSPLALYNSSVTQRRPTRDLEIRCPPTPERTTHNRSPNTLPVGHGLLQLLHRQGRPRPCARPARRLGRRRRHDVASTLLFLLLLLFRWARVSNPGSMLAA